MADRRKERRVAESSAQASDRGGQAGGIAQTAPTVETAQTVDDDKGQDAALGAALLAVENAPHQTAAWERLEQITIARRQPGVAAAAYRRAIDNAATPVAVRVDLGERAARFWQEWLADRSGGLEQILERVLEIDPRCSWALRQLIVAHTLAQRWDALLATYDRALASVPDRERRVALLSEAAQVAKDFVGRQDLAIGYLQEHFALAPADPQVSAALERLLERHERWAELVALWRSRLALVQPDEARAVRERIALCQLEHLADPRAALESLRPLLAERGDQRRAIAALEQILALTSSPEEVRLAALAALRRAYDAAADAPRALTAVEAGLTFATGAARAALRQQAAALRVTVGDLDGAIAHLVALLPLGPDDVEVEDWLRRLCRQHGRPSRLIEGLAAAAAATTDGKRRVTLLREIAAVTERDLDDVGAAITAHRKVAADVDADIVARRHAWHRLDELLDRAGRKAERLPVLTDLCGVAERPSDKRDALGALARLASALGEVDQAVAAWRGCLDLDPQDAEALTALPALLASVGRWGAYVETVRQRIVVSADRRDQSADLARVADVERDALADQAAAITTWTDHQQRFGANPESIDALADLFTDTERWPELHTLLGETSRRDRARAALISVRLGDACRLHLEDGRHAVDWYGNALAADPSQPEARAGLRVLVQKEETRARATDVLVAASLETDDWALRLELRAPRLLDAPAGAARAAVLRECAEIYEQRARDLPRALKDMADALASAPDDRHIEAEVLRLAEGTGDMSTAVQAIEQGAALPGLPARRATELWVLAGRLREQRLSDPAAALAAFQSALTAEPGMPDVRLAVVRNAARADRWPEVAAAIVAAPVPAEARDGVLLPAAEELAAECTAFARLAIALSAATAQAPHLSPEALCALEGRIATWNENQRNDPEAAETSLVRALGHCPLDLPTLRRLAGLQRRAPSAKLFETLLRIARLVPDDLDPLSEATELARQLEPSADRTLVAARGLLDRAVRLLQSGSAATGQVMPSDALASAVSHLTRLYLQAQVQGQGQVQVSENAGGSPEVVVGAAGAVEAHALCVRAAALPIAPALTLAFRRQAVDIALARLDDRPAAIGVLAQMVMADPDDGDVIEQLAALYATERRFAELAELRARQLERTLAHQRRLALRLEMERIGSYIEGASDRVALLMANLDEEAGHIPTIDALAAVLSATHRDGQLADVLGVEAEKVENLGEPAAAAALWTRLALVAENALRDRQRAISAHERAAALIAAAPTLDALGRLSVETGNPEAATRWLDQLLGVAPERDRPAVALRLAHSYLAIDRRHRAIACLERALADAPDARDVRTLLIDLHRRAGTAAPLLALLTDATAYTTDPAELAALAREVAALATGPLRDAALAVTALGRAHAVGTEDSDLVLAFCAALVAASRLDDAAAVIGPALANARRSSERAQLLHHLGRVKRQQGQPAEALAALEQAAAIDLGNTAILQDLLETADAAHDSERAERAARALWLLGRSGDPEKLGFSIVEVLMRLHELARARGDAAQAGELLESAFAAAARDTSEFRRLCARLRASEDLSALLSVLEKRVAAASSPAEEAQAHAELAEVRELLQQPVAALEAVLRAMDLKAEDGSLRGRARDLATRTGQVEEALARIDLMVERRRRRVDVPWVARMLFWAGELVEQQLRDPGRALGYYRRVAEIGELAVETAVALARVGVICDPAERTRGLERLERMVADEVTPEAQAEALFRLAEAQLLADDSRHAGLASLSAAVERRPDVERAMEIVRAAQISNDELVEALPLYERVARAAGNDPLLLDALARRAATPAATVDGIREGYDLAVALRDDARGEELLSALANLAARDTARDAEAVWAFLELGKRRRARGDLAGAFESFSRALQKADLERLEPALRALGEEAQTRGNDPALAARIYETLLVRLPGDTQVWNLAFDLYATLGDGPSCMRLARERLEHLLDPDARNAVRLRLASQLLARDPADTAALDLVRDALLDDPGHREAADLLGRHYETTGDADALADLQLSQLNIAEERQDLPRVSVLARTLGPVLGSTGDFGGALAAYRRGLAAAPGDAALIEGVLKLVVSGRSADEIGAIDELVAAQPDAAQWRSLRATRYRAAQQWEVLAGVLGEQATHENDLAKAAVLLGEVATLYRSKLRNPAAALDFLRRARAMRPHDFDLLRELCMCLAETGDAAQALKEARTALRSVGTDNDARVQISRLWADLLAAEKQYDDALQVLVETLPFATPNARRELTARIDRLRLLSPPPSLPDPEGVIIEDIQEITAEITNSS